MDNPMTQEQLVNLQQRVLRGEAVSDDELRTALQTLAQMRSNGVSAAKPATPAITLSGGLAARLAAARANV